MNNYLVLEEGSIYKGRKSDRQILFPEKAGEVVFNTTHSGYEEVATDPSYFNQIVVMTAPMQGNYGVDRTVWESKNIWIQGFVCLVMQNSKKNSSWADLLVENQVPLLSEIDTRLLVMKLRQIGTPWGALVQADSPAMAREKAMVLIAAKKQESKDWAHHVSLKKSEERVGENKNGHRIAVLDFGAKENIFRELLNRCSILKIFNSRASREEIMQWNPDSLVLTNGPGDPSDVLVSVETVRSLLGEIPIFGICMGHQILALALGAKTYRLKFGHRGANHPIQDLLLNQVYMSSQNHGYAVDELTLPDHVAVTHRHLNDHSVAGIYSEKLNCLGIQYHPESHPGPHDAVGLFDFFIHKMNSKKERKKNDFNATI